VTPPTAPEAPPPAAAPVVPAPAPIPSPVSVPPPAAGKETVRGDLISSFMNVSINTYRGLGTFGDSTLQIGQYTFNREGTYTFGQAATYNQSFRTFDAMTIEAQIEHFTRPSGGTALRLGATLRAQTTPETEEYIFPNIVFPEAWNRMITPSSLTLTADADLLIEPGDEVELDRSLITWRNGAWFVQYQVGSVDEATFRVCWHVLLPSVVRLSCYLIEKETGGLAGVRTADDSDGNGQRIFHQQY
jgi:hypothetical protein